MLLGDLNVNFLQPSSALFSHLKQAVLLPLQLSNLITQPTRFSKSVQTSLDVVLSNSDKVHSGSVKDCEISDHCLVTAILECVHHLPTGKSTSTKYVRHDFRQFNPDTIQMLLQNADLSQFSSHDDVNSMSSGWCGKVLEALDKVAPLKSCRPGPKKKCPFMSAELLHLIHSRKAAYRKVHAL